MPQDPTEEPEGLDGLDESFPFGAVENGEYVAAKDRRLATLERVSEMPATPSQVASDKPVGVASASTAMDHLEDENLVELIIPPDEPEGPMYITTSFGQKTLYYLQVEDDLDS